MPSNVISFDARRPKPAQRKAPAVAAARANVIELAQWIGRSVPRRTPNGVFFTTQVLAFPGDIA